MTTEWIFNRDIVTAPITLYAKWIGPGDIGVTPPGTGNIGLTLSGTGPYTSGTFTVTATTGYDTYQWFIDGKSQGAASANNVLTVTVSTLADGVHSVSVRSARPGSSPSRRVRVSRWTSRKRGMCRQFFTQRRRGAGNAERDAYSELSALLCGLCGSAWNPGE